MHITDLKNMRTWENRVNDSEMENPSYLTMC